MFAGEPRQDADPTQTFRTIRRARLPVRNSRRSWRFPLRIRFPDRQAGGDFARRSEDTRGSGARVAMVAGRSWRQSRHTRKRRSPAECCHEETSGALGDRIAPPRRFIQSSRRRGNAHWMQRRYHSPHRRRGLFSAIPPLQMNWTRIPHMPSMITVAMIPATTAPLIMYRSANALLTPCAIMTARAPAARCARTKNTPSQEDYDESERRYTVGYAQRCRNRACREARWRVVVGPQQSAIAQHATQSQVSATGSCSM